MAQLPPKLPFPLTETLLATALSELGAGWAPALQSCIECYLTKRLSGADLLSFARSAMRYSKSLQAVFEEQNTDEGVL